MKADRISMDDSDHSDSDGDDVDHSDSDADEVHHSDSDADDVDVSDIESIASNEENLSGDNDTVGVDVTTDKKTENVSKTEKQQKKKTKKTAVNLPLRKIGPQKQKKEIHTYLKKAKKFEIRKLSRRITSLRNLKGSDEQKAKNNRKVDKLILEIQAMKEFMIDQITERVVNMFKGTCEQIYLDIWNAAQEHKEFEKMLQVLSNGSDAKKYQDIAFLRMISSKDIVCKLKMINSGTNIIKPKSKKALQKQLRKYNQKYKKVRKGTGSLSAKIKNTTSPVEITDESLKDTTSAVEITGEILKDTTSAVEITGESLKDTTSAVEMTDVSMKDTNVSKPVKSKRKSNNKQNVKNKKKVVDSFFLPAEATVSNNDDDISSDDEFTAPVDEANSVLPKKKNRMGQRRRKHLLEKQHAKSMTDKSKGRRGSAPRNLSTQRKQTKILQPSKTNNNENEKLHPSWQAKQRLKAQQSIATFSGTKITFDD